MSANEAERTAMRRALEIARNGPVGINPQVGAVILDPDGSVLAEGWHRGPKVTQTQDPSDIGPLVEQLMAEARPNADMMGADRA